jgi:hypothetical protein
VAAGDLSASARLEGQAIRLSLAGNADLRAVPALELLLPQLHSEAQRLRVSEVVVDLLRLEFMNSSCFKAFVTWLSRVQESEPARQYRIRFQSDPGRHWQKRSLTALSCFAVDLVHIES